MTLASAKKFSVIPWAWSVQVLKGYELGVILTNEMVEEWIVVRLASGERYFEE